MSTKKEGEWYSPVNVVTRLPSQCRNGYVVLVANSAADEDDYYLKFEGNTESDGEGAWVETYKPGYNVGPVSSTMPHELIRLQENKWVVTPIYWQKREVGDENTAPTPSFLLLKVERSKASNVRLQGWLGLGIDLY